jgi:protoporphyrinogen oxidase
MDYDFIIVGGGISGLNCAYQILKKYPYVKILICDKYKNLGGRIHTYYEKDFQLEAGAGRFNSKHKHLMNLLEELKLKQKIKKISGNSVYADINTEDKTYLFQKNQNSILFSRTSVLIGEIIAYSSTFSEKELIKMTLLDLAKKVLKKEDIDHITSSFGYYTELVIMNAKDAIQLILYNLNPALDFFVLSGGLSQIIENLRIEIQKHKNVTILKNTEITKILHVLPSSKNSGSPFFEIYSHNTKITCNTCICALPRQELQKISIFNPLEKTLNKIKCSPLCRIYSTFREPWFSKLPKITTNNNLRIVIPGSVGKTNTIMMSYTDNKYAEFWNDLYEKDNGGSALIDRELARLMKETTGLNIPKPVNTYVFHWPCGVGYWGVGADSSKISKEILKPFKNKELYICGEHYSEKNQQWMEGALETSNNLVSML